MTTKKILIKETNTKDKKLQTIIVQLQTALPVLKEQLGEKKFEKRIKKAAKLLISGIKRGDVKKSVTPVIKVISEKIVAPAKKAAPAKNAVPTKKAVHAKKASSAKKTTPAKKVTQSKQKTIKPEPGVSK